MLQSNRECMLELKRMSADTTWCISAADMCTPSSAKQKILSRLAFGFHDKSRRPIRHSQNMIEVDI